MKCEHCGKEVTREVILCPFCYTHEQIENMCASGGSFFCHLCKKPFLVHNEIYISRKQSSGKEWSWIDKKLGKAEYIKVPWEWEGWY